MKDKNTTIWRAADKRLAVVMFNGCLWSFFILSVLFTSNVLAAWYDDSWAYRKQIDISVDMTPSTQTDFPVLISINSDVSLSSNAQGNGDDILFTSSDGATKLSHEIEKYTTGTGELAAWVKIPSLSGSSATTLYMYYGNGSAVNQESVSTTWDNNFQAVWHLAEDPSISTDGDCGGGSKEVCDSTINSNDADTIGIPPAVIPAQIEDGLNLEGTTGTGGYLAPPIDNGLNITGSEITLEAWARVPAGGVDNDEAIINKQPPDIETFTYPYMLGVEKPGNSSTMDDTNCRIHTSAGEARVNETRIPRNEWVYLVCRYDGTNLHVYVNNILITSSPLTGSISSGSEIRLGARGDDRRYEGDMDELRISNIARSSDWLTTTYNNQNSPGAYLTVNAEESAVALSGSCTLVDQSTDCADGRTIRVAVNATLQAEAATTSAGVWTISGVTTPVAGDVITVYIEGVADANEAVAVTRYDGTGHITGIQLMEEHLTIGSDDNQTITNAHLSQYDNSVSGDEDIFHEVNGSNDLTVDITGALSAEELYIKSGNTFQPTGNVTTHDLEINGTLIADSNSINLSGSWDNSSGTVVSGTSTVDFTGTGSITAPQYSTPFYNLTAGAAGEVTTFNQHFAINNVLTVGAGEINGASGGIYLSAANPLSLHPSATINNAFIAFTGSGITQILPAHTYNTLIRLEGSTITVSQAGDVTVKYLSMSYGSINTYNTNGHDLTVTSHLTVGENNDADLKTFIATNSTVTVGGNFTVSPMGSGSAQAIATMTGSTLILNGVWDSHITSSGTTLNNLTLNKTGTSGNDNIIVTDALDINGTLTITDGDLDIRTNDPTVNTAGNVTIGAAGSIDVSSRTANWTFDGTSTFTDSSAGQDLEDVVLNGTSLTLGSNAKVQTLTNTAGTVNLGSSGYVLEIDGTGTPLANSDTFTAGTSTVKYTGTTTATNITTLPYSSLHMAPTGATTYSLTGNLTGGNAMKGSLTVDANATLDTTSANDYNLTMAGDFVQSSTTSQVEANGSTLTVGGDFTADGSVSSTGYNEATLSMIGSGLLTYNNLAFSWSNGFNNLTTGQSGNTTTLDNLQLAVRNVLTVGSGTLTGTGASSDIFLGGAPDPLSFNINSTLSISELRFFASVAQNIPPLTNGYDTTIRTSKNNTSVTQTGAVTINADNDLLLDGDTFSDRTVTYNTGGFDLNVGGDIQIGVGGDTALKTLNGENSNITIGENFDIRAVGAGSQQARFISTNSTVTIDGTTAQSITTSGSVFNNLTVSNTHTNGVTFNDAFTTSNLTNITPNSQMTFKGGATYTISGTLNLNGQAIDTKVQLRSTDTSQYVLDVTAAEQSVSNVDVQYSAASSNNIIASNSTDGISNDTGTSDPQWKFASSVTISGIAYTDDDETTPLTSQTVRLIIDGSNSQNLTATTNGSGAYSISATVAAGQILLVYLDTGGATVGNTVTISDGATLTELNIYQNHLVVRQDNGGVLTNANLGTAHYTDASNILYSVDGSNVLTANGANTELYIPTGHSYTPGANVSITDIEIVGTLNSGSGTLTIAGDWVSTSGTVNRDTSTVNFTGTGSISAVDYANTFHNLIAGASGQVTSVNNHLRVKNVLTVGAGQFGSGNNLVYLHTVNPLSLHASATINLASLFFVGGITQNLPSHSYGSGIRLENSGTTVTQLGDVTLSGYLQVTGNNVTATVNTYNTAGYNLTVGTFFTIGTGNDTGLKTFNATNSTVSVGGDFTVRPMGSGSAQAILTTTGSTFIFNGTTSRSLTSSGSSFNDLTLNKTGTSGNDDVIVIDALDINGTLTITDGDLNISTNDPTVNTADNVTIGAAGSIDVSSRTANWTFDGTSTFTDSSAGQDLEDVVLNGTSLTLGSNAKVQTLTNTSGTINLGSSGYVLEIDGTDTPLSNSATFSAGTSTVKYTGTTTATNITTLPYSSVQLTPTAATTYSLTGNLIGANAITGNLSIDTNATLDVTASNFDIDIAGDWSNTGGLTAHSGTVNFNGTNQTVNGSTIFYNLTKSVAAADTLTFAANSTQTIASGGTVTLTGASGQLLTLNCSGCTPGVDHWNLAINGSAFKSIDYVDVSDADASGSDASHTPINPANSNDGGSTISWFGNAMITVMKMSAVITDPVNGGSSPKRIPGAVIEYTVVPSNSGSASPDVNTVVVTDVVDADSVAFDTTTGVSFTDGSTSSGLALGTVTYSSTAAPGPYVYDYTPSAGYDGAVTSIKVTTTGTFNYGGAPDPDFMLRYRVLIK